MGRVVKKVAYHQQIYEILKEKILNGEIKRGEKINEFGLAQEMGVSRSPVREALRMLEQDELIVNSINSGVIVNPVEFQDVLEIYDCRICLEPFAVRMGCQNVNEDILKELDDYVDQSIQYHEVGKMKEVTDCNTRFHDRLIELCPNEHLKRIIDKTRMLSVMVRKDEHERFNRTKGYLSEHKKIVDALRQRDQELVERLMKEHIQSDKRFYIEQSAYTGESRLWQK